MMLNIKITGQFPKLNANLGASMKSISGIMGQSVRENFSIGGRPPWKPTRRGLMQPLLGGGNLFASIEESSGNDWAKVETGSPYARTHHFGRSFIPTQKQGSFFWFKFFETLDPRWKGMAMAAKSGRMFNIPARPFMLFQEEDKVKILQTLSNAIFITSERTQ